ncbi:MAG: hypothetical protein IJ088_15090 [Clostridia bacterium]|nr:hypothetical protein [Clostridia bacterium]
MKKQSLESLLGKRLAEPYESQYRYVMDLIESGRIRPVRTSPGNGKRPALRTQYWLVEEKPDYSAYRDELLYETSPLIHVDYYLGHPEAYVQDRPYVRRLSAYLQKRTEPVPVSCNERSFEIWGEEKFLSGPGRQILSRCGVRESDLAVYFTAEPFACFAFSREVPQKLLILENKDPFFGMRRFLLEGHERILGETIRTLIYGAGKRVVSSFREFDLSAEPYMKEDGNTFLYFGDLDYEGIGIYESLAETFQGRQVIPFAPAYLAMLSKGRQALTLPATREGQNRNVSGLFFSFFDGSAVRQMQAILESGRYIPQEILNTGDY